MPTIKVVDGNGFVTINGAKWPKGSFPVIPLGNGEIQLGVRENTIAKGLFSDYVDDFPEKPISPLVPYADQAAMLAGQAGQVSGEHYYYTGSTSAWLWDGTSGGVIGNYTEKVEGVDWKEFDEPFETEAAALTFLDVCFVPDAV